MLQNELKAMLNEEECIGVPADEEYQEYLIDYILDENLFENELSDYCVFPIGYNPVSYTHLNPTQFGPTEDLEAYPRDFEADCKLCESIGAAMVFHPEPSEMYAPDFCT